MIQTEDQTLSSLNIQKDSQGIPMTLERALNLLGVSKLPEGDNFSIGEMLQMLKEDENRHGEEYIKKYRQAILNEMENAQHF